MSESNLIISQYMKGQIVELIKDIKERKNFKKGLRGKVFNIENGEVFIRWENGRSLAFRNCESDFKIIFDPKLEEDVMKDNLLSKIKLELTKETFDCIKDYNVEVDHVKSSMNIFYNEMKLMSLTKQQIEILLEKKEAILEDIFCFMKNGNFKESKQNGVIIIKDYLKKLEYKYFLNILYEKVEAGYIDGCSDNDLKERILEGLLEIDYLNIEQIKGLSLLVFPLEFIHDVWLNSKELDMKDIKSIIKKTADTYGFCELEAEYDVVNYDEFNICN